MGDEGPVLDRPSMEQRLAHRINTPSLQSMYIMADLHHTVEGWEQLHLHSFYHTVEVHVWFLSLMVHLYT